MLWPPHTVGQAASCCFPKGALHLASGHTTLWNSSSLRAALSQSCFLLLLHLPASTRHMSPMEEITHHCCGHTVLCPESLRPVQRHKMTSLQTQAHARTSGPPKPETLHNTGAHLARGSTPGSPSGWGLASASVSHWPWATGTRTALM